MSTLFKILVDGQSCHGGSMVWDLPRPGKPGEWHEVSGPLVKCARGLHLTTEPARWWVNGGRAYVVEAEGVEGEPDHDCKVVARRVRLMREATEADLAEHGVYLSGLHQPPKDAERIVASGSATVRAYGSATVRAYGSATVEASKDSTIITRCGSPTVVVRERAVWIQRGDGGTEPKVHTAGRAK